MQFRLRYICLLLAMAFTHLGCVSYRHVYGSWKTDPQAFRHIEFAPICVDANGVIDHSQSLAVFEAQCRTVSSNIATIVSSSFAKKGFHFTLPPRINCLEEDWNRYDSSTGDLLREIDREFFNTADTLLNHTRDDHGRIVTYYIGRRLSEMQEKLGMKGADAVVFVHSEIFLKSPNTDWIVSSYVQHMIAIVDAHTGMLLYCNSNPLNELDLVPKDPRIPRVLRGTIRKALEKLPNLNKIQQPPQITENKPQSQ